MSHRVILGLGLLVVANAITSSSLWPGAPTRVTVVEEVAPKSADKSRDEMDMIDEITVLGEQSLGSIRHDIVRAEDHIYEIFNALNADDDYDTTCKREIRIGSQIPYHVCKSRMFRDAASESARDFAEAADGTSGGLAFGTPVMDEQRHSKILREKMRELAADNPQLVEALKIRLELQKAYNVERKKRFD